MADKHNLLLLFDRPLEPCFIPKGENNSVFNVEENTKFLPDRFKQVNVTTIANRFKDKDVIQKINIKDIKEPNLTGIMQVARDDNFSLFIPKHRQIASQLINMFLDAPTLDDLQSLAVYCRDRINPYLFAYSLSVAILHRSDTQGVTPPNLAHIFPDKYFPNRTFAAARQETTLVPTGSRTPIEIPMDYTASDLDGEHRLAYFREDVGNNLHHWHWHLVYPVEGADRIVRKDRRGELFYFFHSQLIARYNFERFCNQLPRVERLVDLKKPIKEAYFPKLDSLVASRGYPGRVPNMVLQNLNRRTDQITLDVDALIRWRNRIYDAIHSGTVTASNGSQIRLDAFSGIDILGNMVEASNLSPNRDFYGDYHAMGHVFLSYIHDPDARHLEPFGVMGDLATTMRDPIFYRWHGHIEDIFQEFKATLPRYTVAELDYPGVTVGKIQVQSQKTSPNVFNTFWQQSDLNLSRGMDFQPRGNVFVRVTHLQHQPFTYNIQVNNSTGSNKMGTCRIWLAPKFDERRNPWLFREQRVMFIEMDRFTVNLRPGQNTINRLSTQSSLTIPFERTFSDLDTNRPTEGEALALFNFCNCGWPQHLLVPKGSPEGFPCELFVMISNYDNDKIEGQDDSGVCNDAPAFCGLRNKKYPDARSMGFPFDRMPRDGVNTLQSFMTPNMAVQDCSIVFNNRTVRPRQ